MSAAERAMTPAEPKSEALRALYWRDEILQVMFWLRGEGFGDDADAPLIERFLGVEATIGIRYLLTSFLFLLAGGLEAAVLRVDGGMGSKRSYDPRTYMRQAQASMAARVTQACSDLMSAGTSLA